MGALRTTSLLICLLLLFSVQAFALELTGDLQIGMQSEWDRGPRFNFLPAAFRLKYQELLPFGPMFNLSVKGNGDLHYKTGEISLDQLWLKGYVGSVDYIFGRQKIAWGTADGFSPTNYFVDSNFTALSSQSINSRWAAQLVYYAPDWSLSLVAIPFAQPLALDYQMQKMILASYPQGYQIIEAIQTTPGLSGMEGMEFALRFETRLKNFDIQASYFSGYESLPGLEMAITMHPALGLPTDVELMGHYRKQHFIGVWRWQVILGLWGFGVRPVLAGQNLLTSL